MAGRDGREKCSELDELSEGGINTFIAVVKGQEEKVCFSGIAVYIYIYIYSLYIVQLCPFSGTCVMYTLEVLRKLTV